MTPIRHLLAAAACAVLSSAAVAAPELVVTPASQTVMLGDTVTVDVMSTGFADAVVGGGFDFSYDASVLSLTGISFGPEWDPLASSAGTHDAVAGTVTGLFFNTFTGSPTGSFLNATLSFKAIGLGSSAITLAANPLFPFANLAAEEVPFSVASGTVQAVPEPATVSLLLAGVGVMGWMARRQRQAQRG